MRIDIDTAVAALPSDADRRQPAARSATVVLTCIAAFMTALNVTIVNIAMPSIQSGLDGVMVGLQWIGAGYTLAFGGLLLAGGTLSDRHGARRNEVAPFLWSGWGLG
jgi:MFS family permease